MFAVASLRNKAIETLASFLSEYGEFGLFSASAPVDFLICSELSLEDRHANVEQLPIFERIGNVYLRIRYKRDELLSNFAKMIGVYPILFLNHHSQIIIAAIPFDLHPKDPVFVLRLWHRASPFPIGTSHQRPALLLIRASIAGVQRIVE